MLSVAVLPPHWSNPGCVAGLGLALFAGVAVAVGLSGLARADRGLVAIVGGALVFQGVHFIEHAAQLSYWILHRYSPPYFTPWAASTRMGLAYWCRVWGGQGGPLARGSELLHLAGNLIFFGGLIGLMAAARKADSSLGWRCSRQAAIVQGLHVIEHAALTGSLFLTGTARGLSTLFGTIAPTSTGAVAYRIWFHFIVNLWATALAVRAVRALRLVSVTGRPTRGGAEVVDAAPLMMTTS